MSYKYSGQGAAFDAKQNFLQTQTVPPTITTLVPTPNETNQVFDELTNLINLASKTNQGAGVDAQKKYEQEQLLNDKAPDVKKINMLPLIAVGLAAFMLSK